LHGIVLGLAAWAAVELLQDLAEMNRANIAYIESVWDNPQTLQDPYLKAQLQIWRQSQGLGMHRIYQ
jgi:hypothetical protein